MMAVGRIQSRKKGEMKQYHLPYKIEVLGRTSCWEKGKGTDISWVGKNIKLLGTLFTPYLNMFIAEAEAEHSTATDSSLSSFPPRLSLPTG